MKNRTFKVIVILVGLLFLNIEAAHAGLIQKFRLYIHHEFPGHQLIYTVAALLTLGLLTYIIFAQPIREKGKLAGSGYYPQESYQDKRSRVKKISAILRESQASNQPHY